MAIGGVIECYALPVCFYIRLIPFKSDMIRKRIGLVGIANENRVAYRKKILADWRASSCRRHRFPDESRYYGREFIRWALISEIRRFGYTGIDAFGEILRYSGFLRYRWSSFRRERNLALIYSFAENLPLDSQSELFFATLTVRHPRRHSYPAQCAAISDLRSAWALFRQYLRRISGLRYLRFIEAGSRNGFAHIHMVLFVPAAESRKVEKIPEKWVRICEKIGNSARISAQNLQKIDSTSEVRNVGAYISKYLSKSLEFGKSAENVDFWRWMEVCYRLRLRCISMDAESRAYIKRKYAKIEDLAGVSGVAGEFSFLDSFSG